MLTRIQKLAAQAIVNIFETGSAIGDYSAVTLLAGDAGHLTYGRSQTTLGSGGLFRLVSKYIENGGQYAASLADYLGSLERIDLSLDDDSAFRRLLADAGKDPIMRETQDTFFDANYWNPAVRTAEALGFNSALGAAVVYDSWVHGSWDAMRNRTNKAWGTPAQLGERIWIPRYLQERRDWMASGAFAYSKVTVFRMDEFLKLVRDRNWDLDLPFTVRQRVISADLFPEEDTLAHITPDGSSRWEKDGPFLVLYHNNVPIRRYGASDGDTSRSGRESYLFGDNWLWLRHFDADGVWSPQGFLSEEEGD